MDSPHAVLLLLILGAIFSICAGLLVLVRRGAEAAGPRNIGKVPAAETGLIIWHDGWKNGDPFTWMQLLGAGWWMRIRTAFSNFLERRRSGVLMRPALADPVDGTAFEQDEPVVRCLCGTIYHQQSWQWLSEKMDGKCVTCKKHL